MATQFDADLIIAGAGPAGLSLALALAGAPLRILLVERAQLSDLAEPRFDGREIALTQASMRRLRSLGAWDRIERSEVFALKRARVLDGQSPFALHFDNTRASEPLGALVPNVAIRRALFEAVAAQDNCQVLTDCSVISLNAQRDHIEAAASGERRFRARLAVAADTRFSPLRQSQGVGAQMLDFGRTMMVCRVAHTTAHQGVATEWFGRGQTIAMLPLAEGISSYVLTLPARDIEALMDLPEEAFIRDAEQRTQGRWGMTDIKSTRHAYPLVAVYADRFVARRFALVGDAAVGMHPVTAHGYNLGLAGAMALAEQLRRAAVRGADIGAPEGLRRYERRHRRAAWPLYTATNALARLYADERALPRMARASALRLMQVVAPVRRALEAGLSA